MPVLPNVRVHTSFRRRVRKTGHRRRCVLEAWRHSSGNIKLCPVPTDSGHVVPKDRGVVPAAHGCHSRVHHLRGLVQYHFPGLHRNGMYGAIMIFNLQRPRLVKVVTYVEDEADDVSLSAIDVVDESRAVGVHAEAVDLPHR